MHRTHDATGVARRMATHLDRLWTPILTAEFLNPLNKLVFGMVFARRLCLAVCAVSFDDLRKSDIQGCFYRECGCRRGGRNSKVVFGRTLISKGAGKLWPMTRESSLDERVCICLSKQV